MLLLPHNKLLFNKYTGSHLNLNTPETDIRIKLCYFFRNKIIKLLFLSLWPEASDLVGGCGALDGGGKLELK